MEPMRMHLEAGMKFNSVEIVNDTGQSLRRGDVVPVIGTDPRALPMTLAVIHHDDMVPVVVVEDCGVGGNVKVLYPHNAKVVVPAVCSEGDDSRECGA